MAELDLYGDLYGDVDDCGSPVALSPSQQTAPTADAQPPATSEPSKPATSSKDEASAAASTVAAQPTTFSISTYEDPSYPSKKHDSSHAGIESWQSDAPHPPRPSSAATHPPMGSAGMGGRPGLWGVKPSDMPDEGSVILFPLRFTSFLRQPSIFRSSHLVSSLAILLDSVHVVKSFLPSRRPTDIDNQLLPSLLR